MRPRRESSTWADDDTGRQRRGVLTGRGLDKAAAEADIGAAVASVLTARDQQ
jgi:hypothetical protein